MQVTLPADLEEFIKTTLASGAYASEVDVIRAALELLQEHQCIYTSELG